MINLLPVEIKDSYRYGRRNVALRKWVAYFLVAIIGLAAVGTYGLLSLNQSSKSVATQINYTSMQLKQAHLTQTEAQVKDISNSLKLSVQVLDKQVLFSTLITDLGAAMPSNTALTAFSINQMLGGIDLTATAADYNAATQIPVNLADPSRNIFSKVDINSITCSGTTSSVSDTKTSTVDPKACTVTMRGLFSANNHYLFINQGNTKP